MPSLVLALETSTPLGSVAVARDGVTCFEQAFSSERSHNSQLFAPLEGALQSAGDSLGRIVVGTGPASYTGVRIGIAAAQGVALFRNVPVIGLPSVLGLAVPEAEYVVCGDARRGSYFAAHVRRSELRVDIATLDAEGFLRHFREVRGRAPWFTFDVRAPLALEGVAPVSPSAASLAGVAASIPDDEFHRRALLPLEPVYLSAPFVTIPRRQALATAREAQDTPRRP